MILYKCNQKINICAFIKITIFSHFWLALTHYRPVLLSISLENIRKPKSFLMFPGDIDKQHRAVMSLSLALSTVNKFIIVIVIIIIIIDVESFLERHFCGI